MDQKFNFKKSFLIALIISLSIGALFGIVIFITGSFGDMEAKILLTTLAVGGYSLTGLCCSVLFDRGGRFAPFAFFGILVSIIGFLFTISIIWEVVESYNLWKPLLILLILAFSSAHSSLMLLIKSNRLIVNISQLATVFFIAIVSLILIYMILVEYRFRADFLVRLLGVFAILDVLGTVVTPILHKVYPKEEAAEELAEEPAEEAAEEPSSESSV